MWFTKPLVAICSAVCAVGGIIGIAIGTGLLIGVDLPGLVAVTPAAKQSVLVWSTIAFLIGFVLFAANGKLRMWELEYQLDAKRGLQVAVDGLAKLRRDGITTLYAVTPSAQTFSAWAQKHGAWEARVVAHLTEHFPFAVVEWFEDLGIIPTGHFTHVSQDPAIQQQHLHHLREIAKELGILEHLIQTNTAMGLYTRPTWRQLLVWMRQEHD
jgi:hypothetical protein